MNTKLRTDAKNEFEKNFFRLINNSVFEKTMENVRNHRVIKLVTSDKRRKRLILEPNHHPHKKFSEHLMAIEMKKTWVKMIKPLYQICQYQILGKGLCKNFGMTVLDKSMETEQNFVKWILIALFFTLKPIIFLKIFPTMQRNGLK